MRWCFSFHFQCTEADCIRVSSRKRGRKRKHNTEQEKGIVEAQCKDCISIPKPMDMEDFKAGVYEGRLTDAVYDVQGKPLQSFISNPFNIAVVGEPGSGKSSFINAIRDLRADDPGAAETGVQTTTLEIKAYPHPQFPQTIFWDLPGKGASSFGEDAFAKQVDLNRYDFFIIVGAQRFRTVHIDLVHEIQRMNKDFYFVRSNTDLDLEASKRQRPSDYNEELILQKIQGNCIDGLKRAGVSNPNVFLVSNYETSRFDFPLLRGKLKNNLPKLKRQAFLLNLPSIYLPVLDKKKTAMNRQILTRAFWLWFIVLIPIPGLSFFPAMKVQSWCYHKFGLDGQSLTALSQMVGKTTTTFKAAMNPMPFNSVNIWSLTELMRAIIIIGDYYHRQHFPFLGCLLSGGISLFSTYFMLKKFVSDGANDTHSVLTEALVREEKKSI